jgi:hypothetical protein
MRPPLLSDGLAAQPAGSSRDKSLLKPTLGQIG